jgi:hypothetical protein
MILAEWVIGRAPNGCVTIPNFVWEGTRLVERLARRPAGLTATIRTATH